MSKGVNKVTIIGNVGNDVVLRYSQQEMPILNLSVATSQTWKRNDGNRESKTEWHKIVLFNTLAKIGADYIKKGSKVYIEGHLQTRKWQDKAGIERSTTEIIAHDMQMLDKLADSGKINSNGNIADDFPF